MSEPSYTTPQAYGPEYYNTVANMYTQATNPAYQRSQAQIRTALGGKGSLYGSPIYAQLGQLEQQRQGGLNTAMSQQMLQGSQFKANEPFQQAQSAAQLGLNPNASVMDYLLGAGNWNTQQAGQPLGMTEYQQALANATANQQTAQFWQSIGTFLSPYIANLFGITIP